MNNTWKTSEFYYKINIHQCKSIQEAILQNDNDTIINVLKPNDLKSRLIVTGPNSPTQALSFLLENIFKSIAPCLTTCITDAWHFIKQLPRSFNYEATLYSCGIENLYTSIPIDLELKAISYWLNNKSNLISPEFVLRNENFKFDKIFYNQTEGTEMGTKSVPSYACLVVGYKEETKLFLIELQKFSKLKKLKLLKKYSDDIWTMDFYYG